MGVGDIFQLICRIKINLCCFSEFADLTLKDLEVITTLGIGSYGRVKLVQVRTVDYELLELIGWVNLGLNFEPAVRYRY